jgi:hypothetical protein
MRFWICAACVGTALSAVVNTSAAFTTLSATAFLATAS